MCVCDHLCVTMCVCPWVYMSVCVEQLGLGSRQGVSVPTHMACMRQHTVVQVAAGDEHSLLVTATGHLYVQGAATVPISLQQYPLRWGVPCHAFLPQPCIDCTNHVPRVSAPPPPNSLNNTAPATHT